jgi:hypothetical protein
MNMLMWLLWNKKLTVSSLVTVLLHTVLLLSMVLLPSMVLLLMVPSMALLLHMVLHLHLLHGLSTALVPGLTMVDAPLLVVKANALKNTSSLPSLPSVDVPALPRTVLLVKLTAVVLLALLLLHQFIAKVLGPPTVLALPLVARVNSLKNTLGPLSLPTVANLALPRTETLVKSTVMPDAALLLLHHQ